MNTPAPNPDPDKTYVPDALPHASAVSGLLSDLSQRAGEPVDALIDALASGQSAAALLDGWAAEGAWPTGRWRELLAGPVGLDALETLKRQAKRAYVGPTPPAQRHAALLAYLLTLALGRVRHATLLSSIPAEVVEDWLIAIGGTADDPLGPLFLEAATTVSG